MNSRSLLWLLIILFVLLLLSIVLLMFVLTAYGAGNESVWLADCYLSMTTAPVVLKP